MTTTNDAVKARDDMLNSVRRELMGPAPTGSELSVPPGQDPVNDYLPYVEAGTREEILAIEKPLQRYGVAVLFPKDSRVEDTETMEPDADESAGSTDEVDLDERTSRSLNDIASRSSGVDEDGSQADGADLVDTTRRQASSFAVSFRVRSSPGLTIRAVLPKTEPGTGHTVNGRYEPFAVNGQNPGSREVKPRTWWVRRQVSGEAEFEVPATLTGSSQTRVARQRQSFEGTGPIELEFAAYARRFPDGAPDDLIVTVVLANRSRRPSSGLSDDLCLFQTYFEVEGPEPSFRALPGSHVTDEAAASLNLIYAKAGTYAIGHGCAADWAASEGVTRIIGTHFPVFETTSMTPDLKTRDGRSLAVSMSTLAGLDGAGDPLNELDDLATQYAAWIGERRGELPSYEGAEQRVATRHLEQAGRMLDRIRAGIELVRTDGQVSDAFRLMNRAMLLQQLRSKLRPRQFVPPTRTSPATFDPPFPAVEPSAVPDGAGRWRPFQIGFILAALGSTAGRGADDRDLVDLIWFPTGGGKTEAYLGLAAFSAILRRLRDPEDAGTDVIMRYTLRLLTAQQFQRASSLICALECIRREQPSLGSVPFAIGLWVGGATTPNRWQEAIRSLNALTRGTTSVNPFLVTSCPWCGAQLGPKRVHRQVTVLGYTRVSGKVKIHCPDGKCDFHAELPVRVVDEDIYERPPTVVIGTVDKFALLTWSSKPRAMFGLTARAERLTSPPNLIIQDELHLITGPLGTMVGAYEPVIEHLCRYKTKDGARPKIVCSTATIRNYVDQNRWLFGRERTSVFPPPMFDIDDSFFGVKATDEDGSPAQGRKYVGVYGSALGSHMAVQVRAYAAVLQGVLELEPERRDPYWTLLGFFNTLRDLGSTTTLLQDQIQHQLKAMWRRQDLFGDEKRDRRRRLAVVEELTGRLRSEEVPRALERLNVQYGGGGTPVDVCLASNMIEVGIDVDRLGLMVVTGQPKTNAQYIQVTGRVGRDWKHRPGLVLVVYAPNRARDRSVFETFRTNHERMYAAVEPASVTPFSLPSLKRTLHATMVAYMRQTLPEEAIETPDMVDLTELDAFRNVIAARIATVDQGAVEDFDAVFLRRREVWDARRPMKWNNWSDRNDDDVLLVPAGDVDDVSGDLRWRTPQSLRNVDSECLVDMNLVSTIELGTDSGASL